MMTELSMHLYTGLCFATAAFSCVLLGVVGIPGGWLLIAFAIGVNCAQGLWLPPDAPHVFHWITILSCVFVGIAGEFVELALGGYGAKLFGASKRGVIGAVIGSPVGAVLGTLLIPIPIVGTLVGAGLGAALGALAGELLARKRAHESWKPALGAAVGRILGSLAKLPFIVTIAVILATAAFVP